jgi:hypothetical protein
VGVGVGVGWFEGGACVRACVRAQLRVPTEPELLAWQAGSFLFSLGTGDDIIMVGRWSVGAAASGPGNDNARSVWGS